MSRSAPITRGSHLQGDSAVELLAENPPYVSLSEVEAFAGGIIWGLPSLSRPGLR